MSSVARLCSRKLSCKQDAPCLQKLVDYAAPDDLAGYSVM